MMKHITQTIMAGIVAVSLGLTALSAAPAHAETEADALAEGIEAYDTFKYDEAAAILKPLADAGNAEAQYRIAYLHLLGKGGMPESPERLFSYAEKAEKQGHLGARLMVAEAYLEGSGTKQNIAKGIELTRSVIAAKTASNANIADAHLTMAFLYEEGMGVAKSPKKAVEHYKKSQTANSDKFTLIYLVDLLDDGHGGSFEQEVDWYRQLAAFGNARAFAKIKAHADQGDAHSQYIVGNVYYGDQTFGLRNATNIGDIERNGQRNWEYWERAAKGGIGEAAVKSVGAFTRGMPDNEQLAKAAYWLKKAPTMKFLDESNRAQAFIALGDAYFSGRRSASIPKDLTKAEEHYRKAKHGDGLNEVAKAHLYAKDTAKNVPKGFALLQECAALDNAKCQFNLGLNYVFGLGTERSYEQALKWFDLSATNGYARGKSFADDLRRRGKLPDVKPDQ
ncbi:SEL1-like repeat protein [Pontixanthobacter aestiaquae]|uniref:TPR repeat n=1 Tax=Pontixanthobacter aestiaquae TaxID=1509367 RepID=A0A844Z889_9SPHN|nr:SEL1-like repeat protein [Pontixanthobacter aestiaquae]MDN3645853.1 SEL1-like repeat protein [Pontixanthobacter aestiaquae]MXO83153.1 hypothetical protein [Pontixanthobacter aestiaquae]